MVGVLTTEFWLSVFFPGVVSIALVGGGIVMRRRLLVALGVVGLVLVAGWLALALYAESVIE